MQLKPKICQTLMITMKNLKSFANDGGKSFFSGLEKFQNLGEISSNYPWMAQVHLF